MSDERPAPQTCKACAFGALGACPATEYPDSPPWDWYTAHGDDGSGWPAADAPACPAWQPRGAGISNVFIPVHAATCASVQWHRWILTHTGRRCDCKGVVA